jgi:hypothetical protein
VRTSAILRGDLPDAGRIFSDIVKAEFEMDALAGWRVRLGAYAGTPWRRWPDRPRGKTSTAIGTYIVELVLDTVRTECAFVAADPCLRRSRWKVLVAIFTVRSQLQRHGRLCRLDEADYRKSAALREGRISLNFGRQFLTLDHAPENRFPLFGIMSAAAALSFPSSDRARSMSAHAPRFGAASARY